MHPASRCSARAHLTALTGARRSPSPAETAPSLFIQAAALALGLNGAGRIALLGARSAHRPHRRETLASACSFSSLSLHSCRCSRPRPEPHRPARRALSSPPSRACCSSPPAASALSLSISAAALALSSSVQAASRCSACAQLTALTASALSLHLGSCSCPWLERCRPHRAARRALSSPPSQACRSPPPQLQLPLCIPAAALPLARAAQAASRCSARAHS